MDFCLPSHLFGPRQLRESLFSGWGGHWKMHGRIHNWLLMQYRCKFAIGRLLMFEEKYNAAEKMLLESQSMWLAGDKSRALDFNGIIVYQLGCCALLQGNIDAAL